MNVLHRTYAHTKHFARGIIWPLAQTVLIGGVTILLIVAASTGPTI